MSDDAAAAPASIAGPAATAIQRLMQERRQGKERHAQMTVEQATEEARTNNELGIMCNGFFLSKEQRYRAVADSVGKAFVTMHRQQQVHCHKCMLSAASHAHCSMIACLKH